MGKHSMYEHDNNAGLQVDWRRQSKLQTTGGVLLVYPRAMPCVVSIPFPYCHIICIYVEILGNKGIADEQSEISEIGSVV